jgi:hypothetical protein
MKMKIAYNGGASEERDKNNRTDENKIVINLHFRCLENYTVNLFGEGAFRNTVENPRPLHPA